MGETLKLVSAGNCIQIWNLLLFSPEACFNPHGSEHDVSSVCWSSNNQFLVSASSGGDNISVSSCKTNPVQLFSLAEQSGQTCVSLNSTSNLILSGGTDCAVNLWDIKTKKLKKSYMGHRDIVTCLVNDAGDHWIFSGSRSGEIVLHSMQTDEVATKLCCRSRQPLHDLQISCLQASHLGSVGNDGTVVLWDLNLMQLQHSFEKVHKAPATALCFSPFIESLIVTVGLDKQVLTIDTRCKSILHSIQTKSPLTAVELLPDGTTLMIGSSQGKVSLYDFRNMEFPVRSSKAHNSAVRCIKLQTVRGKLQGAWPTACGYVKGEAYNVSVAMDTRDKNVTSEPSGAYSLQVNSFTASTPFSQMRKEIFLATHSFGQIFSPIGSDVGHASISAVDEFLSSASNCTPIIKNYSNVKKPGELSTMAVTKAPKQFSEATCLAAERCAQAQNLHCCNSELELIEQETNPRAETKLPSCSSLQPGKEREKEHGIPWAVVQLMENMLKNTLEEFSELQHREIVGLQLAMIQEFQNQQIAVGEVILKHLVAREELIMENKALKEENQKLNIFL